MIPSARNPLAAIGTATDKAMNKALLFTLRYMTTAKKHPNTIEAIRKRRKARSRGGTSGSTVLVTTDELPEGASGLCVETRLNGNVLQSGNTDDMIFPVADLVFYASEAMTLDPGDIIVTGTPAGVGFARTPPIWMKPGDVCEVEIEGVGILRNPVGAEE